MPTEKEMLKAIGSVDVDKVQADSEDLNGKSDEMLVDLMDNIEHLDLSVWDYDFVNDLINARENKRNVSLKQYEQILRIYNKHL